MTEAVHYCHISYDLQSKSMQTGFYMITASVMKGLNNFGHVYSAGKNFTGKIDPDAMLFYQ